MVKNRHAFSEPPAVPQVPFARRQGSAFGVEVIALGELRQRKMDHSIFKAHRIEFHILFVVTGGRGSHMVDFVHYPVARGTVAHTAPGQVQHFDAESDLSGFLVLFQPEVGGLAAPRIRWPVTLTPTEEDFELLETLTGLIFGLKARKLSQPPDRLARRMLSAILELYEGAVAQQSALEGKRFHEDFEAFDALLDKNLTRHRELGWYARTLECSEKTLSRWCRQVSGLGAKAYIDRRVALEAKRLLVHTEYSIESIAERLGFSESTNFIKFFRRLEGQTPTAFRKSYK